MIILIFELKFLNVFQNLKEKSKSWLEFFLPASMRNRLLIILLFCFGMTCTINAQQKKPVKKATPKTEKSPKKLPPPPPPPPRPIPPPRRQVPPPPPKMSELEGKNPSQEAMSPMIMESSESAKFRREKICTDCDTLKIEKNKKHIIIYDVYTRVDYDSRAYRKQPTQADLDKGNYMLKGVKKREWDELRKNFSPKDYTYHHVYRNTYIQVENDKKQVLNLLDRSNSELGFVYWSGKPAEDIFENKRMALLTEFLSSKIGLNKKSAYYSQFVKDSLAIEHFQKPGIPSSMIAENINTSLIDKIFGEPVFPTQFFNLKKVETMNMQSAAAGQNKKISLRFDKIGHLTKVIERNDTTVISYKNGLPSTIKERNNDMELLYRGDTLVVKEQNYLTIYKLINKTFFEIRKYNIGKADYDRVLLSGAFANSVVEKTGSVCSKKEEIDGERIIEECYSNTDWKLPLTIQYKSYVAGRNSKNETVFRKEGNALVVENINEYKSIKVEYGLVEGKPASIKSSFKRGGDDYSEPFELKVSYTYFK